MDWGGGGGVGGGGVDVVWVFFCVLFLKLWIKADLSYYFRSVLQLLLDNLERWAPAMTYMIVN